MPTYTYTRTREQLRDMIGRKLGVKESGQAFPAEEAAIIDEGIDLKLKELHSLGVLWWQVSATETNLSLTGGVESVTMGMNDFLFPVSLHLMVGNDRQEITIVDRATFLAIPDRTSAGEPEVAHFYGLKVYFNPVPVQNYTAKLAYQAIAADSSPNTAVDVPIEMLRAFSTLVSFDLADDFAVDGATFQRLQLQAPTALSMIRTLNAQKVQNTIVQPEWF